MNKKHPLTFKNPSDQHKHRKLNGHIRRNKYSFFVLEFNPKRNTHELLVEATTPTKIRDILTHQWQLIAEGSYDYCLGFLHGHFDDIKIKGTKK